MALVVVERTLQLEYEAGDIQACVRVAARRQAQRCLQVHLAREIEGSALDQNDGGGFFAEVQHRDPARRRRRQGGEIAQA